MTDIERMAREGDPNAWGYHRNKDLIRFAELVRAQERERCAAIVQANADECQAGSVMYAILSANAAAIRST